LIRGGEQDVPCDYPDQGTGDGREELRGGQADGDLLTGSAKGAGDSGPQGQLRQCGSCRSQYLSRNSIIAALTSAGRSR
jgi:hypothetical protein